MKDPTTIILQRLFEEGLRPRKWYFGHYHLSGVYYMENTRFQVLDMLGSCYKDAKFYEKLENKK